MPPLINADSVLDPAIAAVARQLGDVIAAGRPSMGAEDFAEFAERVPSFQLRIGSGAPGRHDHLHNDHYQPDERCIGLGVQALSAHRAGYPGVTRMAGAAQSRRLVAAGGRGARRRAAGAAVIFPMGSLETHGPQAPMGDFLLAEALADRMAAAAAAQGTDALVLPAIPFGGVDYFSYVPGGIVLSPATCRRWSRRPATTWSAPASAAS